MQKKKSSFAVIEYQKEAMEYKEKVKEVEERTQKQLKDMQKRLEGALNDHVGKENELRVFRNESEKEKFGKAFAFNFVSIVGVRTPAPVNTLGDFATFCSA